MNRNFEVIILLAVKVLVSISLDESYKYYLLIELIELVDRDILILVVWSL